MHLSDSRVPSPGSRIADRVPSPPSLPSSIFNGQCRDAGMDRFSRGVGVEDGGSRARETSGGQRKCQAFTRAGQRPDDRTVIGWTAWTVFAPALATWPVESQALGCCLAASNMKAPILTHVSRCGLAVRRYRLVSRRTSVQSASALLSLQKLWFMDTVL